MRRKINYLLLVFLLMLFPYVNINRANVIDSSKTVLLQTDTNGPNNNGINNNGINNNTNDTDNDGINDTNNNGINDTNDNGLTPNDTNNTGTLTDTDADNDDNNNAMSNILYGGSGLLLGGIIMYIIMAGGKTRDHK